jgi:hypothetical protein
MGNIIKTADKKEIKKIIKQYLEYNKKNKFSIIDKITNIDLGDYYEDEPDDKSSILLLLTSKKYKLEFFLDIDEKYYKIDDYLYLEKEININETKITISVLYECKTDRMYYNYDIYKTKEQIYIQKDKNKTMSKFNTLHYNNIIIKKYDNIYAKYIYYNIANNNNLNRDYHVLYYKYNYKYYLLNKIFNIYIRSNTFIITNNNYYKLLNIFL